MSFEFECPSCQALLRVPVDRAGTSTPCPCCRNDLLLPPSSHKHAPLHHPQFSPPPVRFHEILATSWRLFTRHLPALLGSLFFKFVVFLCAILGVTVIALTIRHFQLGIATEHLFALLLPFPLLFASAYTALHSKRLCLSIAAGDPSLCDESLSNHHRPFHGVGSILLFQTLLIGGLALFILPGVAFWLSYWPHNFYLILPEEDEESPYSAAQRLTQNRLEIGMAIFVAYLVLQFSGLIAFIVGILITSPFLSVVSAVAFLRLRGLPVSGDPGYSPVSSPATFFLTIADRRPSTSDSDTLHPSSMH